MCNIVLIGIIILLYIICGYFIHAQVLIMMKSKPNDIISKTYNTFTHKQKMIMYYSFLFLWFPGLLMQIFYYGIIAISKHIDD